MLLLLAAGSAEAARRAKDKPAGPEPRPAKQAQPDVLEVFGVPLPLDPGPLPDGLANLSAQGCHACHYEAHAGWSGSAHATGIRSERYQRALEEVGTPACKSCHLPLTVQHPQLFTYEEADPSRAIEHPNPGWSATLATEGVTCAACHVRDGTVLTAHPDVQAPHPTAWAPALAEASTCAACHQLTWPGASTPFYDTWGEWSRSAYASAGVQCQDCHMEGGLDGRGPSHAFTQRSERAVSVLVDLGAAALTRGGEAITGELTLQNTGAGHAFPTGSPYRGVQLQVVLTAMGEEAPVEVPVLDHWLGRTLQDAAPWDTTEDTRLQAGATQRWPLSLSLDQDQPPGPWTLEVRLVETHRGTLDPEPLVVQRIPLATD